MISAKRVTCVYKLLEDSYTPWKTILDRLLLPVGGRFVFHCSFQTSRWKIILPAYFKACFDACSELNGKTLTCYKGIINDIIWRITNFFVMIKKSLYRRNRVNLGFLKRLNFCKQFLLFLWYFFNSQSQTKVFPNDYKNIHNTWPHSKYFNGKR